MSFTGARSRMFSDDAWAWWQARRLRYNIALAAAGWGAYGLNAALFYAFNRPIWQSVQQALAMTLALGGGFLVVMGIANVCFLLGPAVETVVKPADREGYRQTAFAMGFWGSVALPFLFPLAGAAILLSGGG